MNERYSVPVDLVGQHLRICRSAASRAGESGEYAEDVLVAVVFGAAAFEGFLDSVVTHSRINNHDPLPERVRVTALAGVLDVLEKHNAQWLLKLQVIALVLSEQPVPRGAAPWQDIEFLFRIRNSIIHPSLTWDVQPLDPVDASFDKITSGLIARGIVQPPPPLKGLPGSAHEHVDIAPPPIMSLMKPEVAKWCVATAEAGIRGVIEFAPPAFRSRLQSWVDNAPFAKQPAS